MTIKEQADELVNEIEASFSYMVEYGNTKEASIVIAIIAQERFVNELIELKYEEHSDSFWYIENKILQAQELLTELKSRI